MRFVTANLTPTGGLGAFFQAFSATLGDIALATERGSAADD